MVSIDYFELISYKYDRLLCCPSRINKLMSLPACLSWLDFFHLISAHFNFEKEYFNFQLLLIALLPRRN